MCFVGKIAIIFGNLIIKNSIKMYMSNYILFAIASSLLAILYGLWTAKSILSMSAGSARMQEISGAIRIGAEAFLNKQYKAIAPIALIIFGLLSYFLDKIGRASCRERG